jgi:hypothetical protein
MLDFHHNPMGAKNPGNYVSNSSSTIYSEFPVSLLGRDYLLPNLSYQFSPLLSFSSSAFFNLNDSSFLNTSGLEWNFLEDLLLSWNISLAHGIKSSMQTEKNSEFGDTPNSFKLILKHYR